MKKSVITFLLALTFSFVTFVAGFYVGRNSNHSNIHISGVNKIQSTQGNQAPSSTSSAVPTTLDETTRRLMAAINAATLEQWDEVPGIGEATARKILEYRSTYGDFQTPDDLDHVEDIGS